MSLSDVDQVDNLEQRRLGVDVRRILGSDPSFKLSLVAIFHQSVALRANTEEVGRTSAHRRDTRGGSRASEGRERFREAMKPP